MAMIVWCYSTHSTVEHFHLPSMSSFASLMADREQCTQQLRSVTLRSVSPLTMHSRSLIFRVLHVICFGIRTGTAV